MSGAETCRRSHGSVSEIQAVEERRVLTEAVPKGAVDSTGERMLA